MEITPTPESSNVREYIYLEAWSLLLIRFRDESLYAYRCVSAATAAALVEAPSKGRFIRQYLAGFGLKVSRKEDAEGSQIKEAGGLAEAQRPPVLNSIDEGASKCCRVSLKSAFPVENIGPLLPRVCGTCGTEFSPEMVGSVRHWKIRPAFTVGR